MAGRPQHTGGSPERGGGSDDPIAAEPLLRTAEHRQFLSGRRALPDGNNEPGSVDIPEDSILESLNAAVVVLDDAFLILSMNPAAENLLGMSRERARGEPLLKLVGEEPGLGEMLRRVAETGDHYAAEFTLAPNEASADERLVDCHVSPFTIDGAALLIEMTDITRRSRISRENALLMQHGAGRKMIRQLAHEIKNPLGGIRGAAQLLERQLDDRELEEYTRVVISETDRLAALVNTLLGPGGMPLKSRRNVHELLEYVVRLVDTDLGERVSIRRDYDPGLPDIPLDRDQFVQALLNLVRNAVEVLNGQGTLTLRTRAVTNFTIGDRHHRVIASIEIEDDGPGVPPELKDSVFYPLVTGRPGGTGLGLPVAQELISRHGGLIEFESRPGRTVFLVRLPIAGAREDEESET